MKSALLPPNNGLSCLTSARGSLYDGQFLRERQLEGFHLRLIQPQLLLPRPGVLLQAAKGLHVVLKVGVGNIFQIQSVYFTHISWVMHIWVALHDVSGKMLKTWCHSSKRVRE